MKTKSLLLAAAAAFAILATPAQAGDRRYRNYERGNDCDRGGNYGYYQQRNQGYYQQRDYCPPVQYYRPASYRPAPVFYGTPFFQISFGGGNRGCR